MSDPRVYKLDHFTKGQHNKAGQVLSSSANSLPTPYHVCVIGASNGIGAGVATSYARAGCTTLVIASRDVASMASVAKSVRSISPSTTVYVQPCDITSPAAVRALAEFVTKNLGGRLDVLAVSSGYSGTVQLKITDGSPEDGEWAQALAVNVLGTYHAAHYFVPLLLASPPGSAKAFVVVGSIAAAITKGTIANSKYCIGKMGQARIVEHMSNQFREEGLFAIAVHPGSVMTDTAALSAPEAFKKYLIDDTELCGAFCAWLTRDTSKVRWLSGRLVSANWDPEELLDKKEDIIKGDLLKFEAITRIQE